MRLFLSLMAVAMLTVAIGCEAEQAAQKPAKSSDTPAAKPAATPESTDSSDTVAVKADTSGMQEVSLKLPGMT